MDLIVTYIYALNSKDALAFTISENTHGVQLA
jgi:hypothetical protein